MWVDVVRVADLPASAEERAVAAGRRSQTLDLGIIQSQLADPQAAAHYGRRAGRWRATSTRPASRRGEVDLAGAWAPRAPSSSLIPESAPATDENRAGKDRENWLVMIGICTHLGCIPKGQSVGDPKGDYDGWFCPCHGSQYDSAGRVRVGPAPQNMAIPPYAFTSDTKVKIG